MLVRIRHAIDDTERLGYCAREFLVELLGQGQQQRHEGIVVLRLDRQGVETDALGLGRLVQQAIPFGLRTMVSDFCSMCRLRRM